MTYVVGKNKRILDFIIYSAIIFIVGYFLVSLNYSNSRNDVLLSLFAIGIYSFIAIVSNKSNINIRKNFHIFVFIFFFMAPLQQYTTDIVLWRGNGLAVSYSHNDYLKTSFLVLLAMVIFDVGYLTSKSRVKSDDKTEKNTISLNQSRAWILVLMSSVAFLILALTNNIVEKNNFIGNINLYTQVCNMLRFIPVCSLLFSWMYVKEYGWKNRRLLTFVVLFESLLIFFPIWGVLARYILFGTYIVLYSFWYSDSKYKSVYFAIIFLGFCTSFSELRYNTSISNIIQGFTLNFNSPDFDAFQITMAGVKYVDEFGSFNFLNIISSLLFIVPRSVIPWKLESTGALVVRHYGSWFENVSSSIFLEFYAAAGIIGVILLSFLLGRIICKIDSYSSTDNYIQKTVFCIITGLSIYIFRGSMLAAFAFTGGVLLSVFFLYYICRIK